MSMICGWEVAETGCAGCVGNRVGRGAATGSEAMSDVLVLKLKPWVTLGSERGWLHRRRAVVERDGSRAAVVIMRRDADVIESDWRTLRDICHDE